MQKAESRKQKKAKASYCLPLTAYRLLPERGMTTLLVLAFMGIFLMILGTLTSYAFQQSKYGQALYGREQALHIAEAGLERYRWFLAHFPDDLQNGTGEPGPYTYTVVDPEGGQLGTASLSITGNMQCGVIQSIDIESRGVSDLNPGFPRTLSARYMQKSVAAYSNLLNSSVHAGADRVISGSYFSNGGIRMSGTNNSDVQSALSSWSCTATFGCTPTETKPGVWGSGSGSALWSYPEASIDFNAISVNLVNLKTYAQTGGGVFYAQASESDANERGYHIILQSDSTFDIYRVEETISVPSYTTEGDWDTEFSIIESETLIASDVAIPSSCSLIFVEDRVWLEGVVLGKVTLVAATPADAETSPDVFLMDDITYGADDGTSGLTVIAERDITISLDSPDYMELHGVFVAQNGRYGRNHYTTTGDEENQVPSEYDSYVLQSELLTIGTVVSNYRTGTVWKSGGVALSGYLSRIDAYDQTQATNPAPFTPAASADYSFVLWREN